MKKIVAAMLLTMASLSFAADGTFVQRPQNRIVPKVQTESPSRDGSHMFIWVLLGIGGVLNAMVYATHHKKRVLTSDPLWKD